MARSLRNSKVDDFEPKRKNPIGLLDDSNLDSDLKTLLIGNKSTGIELSDTNTRINTDLNVEKLVGYEIRGTKSIYLDESATLILNNNSESVFAGNTYIKATDTTTESVLDVYVGNTQKLEFVNYTGLGNDYIEVHDSDLKIDSDKKLYFGAAEYITVDAGSDDMLFSIGGSTVFELEGDGQIKLKNNTTVDATTDDIIDFSTDLSATNLIVSATDKVLLDGASGHTYLAESADDILDIYVGGVLGLQISELTTRLIIPATWGLYFDGGTHTFIEETSADILDFKAGNVNLLKLNGNTSVSSFTGTLKIAEQADAASDTAGYGQIWVDTATPNELAFTDDAGTDIIGIGKYHYETKFIGYYANGTTAYLPMTGYVIEGTTSTSRNEFQGFCAPYNCTIEKVTYRSEALQGPGDISFRVLEADDGTEIPGTTIFRKETTVAIADDTYQELDMTSPTTGSDYSPLTKGKCYQFYLATPATGYDTNVTIVFKWDITS